MSAGVERPRGETIDKRGCHIAEDAGIIVWRSAALSRSSYFKPPALPEVADFVMERGLSSIRSGWINRKCCELRQLALRRSV